MNIFRKVRTVLRFCELGKKIHKVIAADPKDGGEGAIYIFLKNKKVFRE